MSGLDPAKRGVTPDSDPGSSPPITWMDSGVGRNDCQYTELGRYRNLG